MLRRVIGLAAISDIEVYAEGSNSCQKATPSFMGGKPENMAAQYKLANPVNKLRFYPVTLLHGSEDNIVPVSHSKVDGAVSKLLQGGGHFDWIHPKSDAFQMLLSALREDQQV